MDNELKDSDKAIDTCIDARYVADLEKQDDGSFIAKNIKFVSFGLVRKENCD